MDYISSKGHKFNDIEKFTEFVDEGTCGKIYRYGDVVFKKYDQDVEYFIRLQKNVFDFLKTIESPSFIKLQDIYMQAEYPKFLLNLFHLSKFKVDGYTAKYYENEDINPLFYSKDYLLESFLEIEKVFNYLSKNRMLAIDIKRGNTIYTKDGLVLVDPDLFEFSGKNKKDIAILNKRKIFDLLQSILIEDQDSNDISDLVCWFIDNFQYNIITPKMNVTDHLADTLKYVKRPIDIVRK